MMDELTTTCYRCGAQGATKYVESLNAWVHHDMRRCVSALRANAKAAEKRVQELEAELAAQEWRPVTEPPTEKGLYLVYDADGERFFHAGIWPYRVVTWRNGWGSSLDGLADYWRPLPPPPPGG